MLKRECVGGIVFFADTVLLIKNDKDEWSFPKAVIRNVESEATTVAVDCVMQETQVKAYILSRAGKTNYEFYSITRKKPVANSIEWYIMSAQTDDATPNLAGGIMEAVFVPVAEALEQVTYTQDRSLLAVAYQKYCELNEREQARQ